MTITLDERYQIQPEYLGYSTIKWSIRFCGVFLGYGNTKEEATEIALKCEENRQKSL